MEARDRTAEIMVAEARKAFWVMVGFLAFIWLVQIANWVADYMLSRRHGVEAWDLDGLPGIVSAPFLHWDWEHIQANSGPLFIFGFLAAYRGVAKFLWVTGLIILASGLGVWFTSDPGSVTAGASGVVFGYFGYVLVRGAFDRHLIDIVIGVVMALCFAYQFAGLLPQQEGISWQGHLFGFVGGVLGGWLFRDRRSLRPAAPAAPPGSAAALLKEIDDLGRG
ncbi:rhomboid family intramembrane serine protease [Planobispora rosea]|uniref:Rhomboid family intramembrane serine protease n=1 Tax=Planobispora rosea TaxID=35762 RepID=A0A8J3S6B5_PLARO|nr:rhomboid family intramembrane serine protease [Planobispora rosea]GGS79144.1 rhomboid family intramembrane serine protease [Planobispora rosea]GIH85764.1 rhomboid family intramembrane serine protease [Planobispora rosea]